VADTFVVPLLDAILGDYQSSPPITREAEVLSLIATVVEKLQVRGQTHPPEDMPAAVRQCSASAHVSPLAVWSVAALCDRQGAGHPRGRLPEHAGPDHRQLYGQPRPPRQLLPSAAGSGYALLPGCASAQTQCRAAAARGAHGALPAVQRCNGPTALIRLPPVQFKLVIDAIVWGFKHIARDVSEMALELLLELLVRPAVVQVDRLGRDQRAQAAPFGCAWPPAEQCAPVGLVGPGGRDRVLPAVLPAAARGHLCRPHGPRAQVGCVRVRPRSRRGRRRSTM